MKYKILLLLLLIFLNNNDICNAADNLLQSALIPKTADELDTPICTDDSQCAIGGICRPDNTGNKRCMCSTSCYMTVPVSCAEKNPISCMTMGENYIKKYNISLPYCYHTRCVCPPQYDPLPVREKTPGFTHMPPMKCDKRELKIMLTISPADSVYKGTEALIYCCINQDPRDFVPYEGVVFLQNNTRNREPTNTPYDMFSTNEDTLFTVPTCWSLTISNVQLSDSGTYTCIVQPNGNYPSINKTINFTVKTPRMIQNVTIIPGSENATMKWDIQEGPMLKIGIKLYKRAGGNQQIIKIDSARSPIMLNNLEPATPYTVYITVQDGQAEPFELTEQFQSLDGQSGPPQREDIRLTNSAKGLQCLVEWRPPHITNGQILRYYVQLKGELRYKSDSITDIEEDYPPGLEGCSNYDGIDETKFIDARTTSFLSCKYGPLKPNRNYTATIWAENNAGKSEPVTFLEKCSMDYAEPENIEPPESSLTPNSTSFSLTFTKPPKETNGPIACYYLAIVPLPSNASVQKLPKPNEIIMDSFEAAMMNNVRLKSDKYFAYIAESYSNYPKETIIGDNKQPIDVDQCNTLYLSRYKPQDIPLQNDLKYTGFLIVRVDRDSKLHNINYERILRTSMKNLYNYRAYEAGPRFSRQLSVSDPAYGFSTYFKPIFLESNQRNTTSALTVFTIIFLSLLILIILAGFVLYLLYKKGLIRHLCPIKKDHNLLRQAFQPISVEDLASEFIIRHRDSDFLFTSEFDALPKPNLSFSICDRKDNERKNRYHDIKACDETRVKIKNVGIDGSDYINANYIKGYNGKKTFIAAQAPLDNTINDFWKMIWEQDVKIVIMVANINERGRKQATKYWPNIEEENMLVNNDLGIECKKTEVFADYVKREFELVYVSQKEREALARSGSFMNQQQDLPENDYANVPVRPNSKNSNRAPLLKDNDLINKEIKKITHYHFTNWVDLKAPESTCGILRLMLKLRKTDEYLNHPVLIHCSAGVGRTGTFVAIDTLMDQCIAEGKADVFGTVTSIRYQRNGVMVQTMEQYAFIYRAIAEHFLFGDTDISMDEFCHYYAKLKHVPRERRISGSNGVRMSSIQASFENNGSPSQTTSNHVGSAINAKLKQWKNGKENNVKISGIEKEYELLFTNIDPIRTTMMGQKEENIHKNRYPDIIPYDRYRVILAPRIGCSSSSQYINATPHRGYWQHYVLAQDPLENDTVYDFWRMIDDGRSTTIVMLSKEDEFTTEEKYWPEQIGTPLIFGKDNDLIISLISERIHPSYVERKLQYKFKREEETCEVIQYSFLGWVTGSPTPTTSGPLIELALKVLAKQNKFPNPGPIIVHSRDGSFEPAVFVAIASLIERVNIEKMVDVFRTCRSIYQHRSHVFTKFEQYTFIYDTMAEYIRNHS